MISFEAETRDDLWPLFVSALPNTQRPDALMKKRGTQQEVAAQPARVLCPNKDLLTSTLPPSFTLDRTEGLGSLPSQLSYSMQIHKGVTRCKPQSPREGKANKDAKTTSCVDANSEWLHSVWPCSRYQHALEENCEIALTMCIWRCLVPSVFSLAHTSSLRMEYPVLKLKMSYLT